MTAAAARTLEPDNELPADFRMSPDSPPLTPLERNYLLGNATPEEAEQVRHLFAMRSEASPDGVFVCGFLDDDEGSVSIREGSIVRVDTGGKCGRPGVVVGIDPQTGRAIVAWGTGTLRDAALPRGCSPPRFAA